ncbi:ABC transporter permease [Cytobacillus kochii]|uniref:ABC transporter permease n=1 Tax=Cytobacillus kochii TaxID=859143 RepID=UPI00384C1E3A
MMRVLRTIPYTVIRMSRDYITLLLLLVVPIILITIFYFVLGDLKNQYGDPAFYDTAQLMTLVFQLFGGSIVIAHIQDDLFSPRRQRLMVAPMSRPFYALSISLCGMLYSIFLGFLLFLFTGIGLKVEWGNGFWVMYIIGLLAVLSSLVSLILIFAVKNFKLAERLSEVYGIGCIVLAGLFFPIPNYTVITFINEYLNPLLLAANAIGYAQSNLFPDAYIYMIRLGVGIVITFIIVFVLGRRKI